MIPKWLVGYLSFHFNGIIVSSDRSFLHSGAMTFRPEEYNVLGTESKNVANRSVVIMANGTIRFYSLILGPMNAIIHWSMIQSIYAF